MIDHLLWAVPSLEEGRHEFAELSGVEAAPGGRHIGVGTENALVGLGGGERYLEIIALDPTQTERSSLGLALEGLREPGLLTWCARARDLGAVAASARRAGFAAGEPVAMSRERPDGARLEWRLLFLIGDDEHLVPFFIEWGEDVLHPSRSAPGGCRLESFVLFHPAAGRLSKLLADLGLDVEVAAGPSPRMVAKLETPRGAVTLEGPPGGLRGS